jgi:outer membrane protein assembly factor BamB
LGVVVGLDMGGGMGADARGDVAVFRQPAANNPALSGVGKATIYYPCLTRLYAVNLEDGTLKWQYPADAPLNATIIGQPVEGEGLVYIGVSNGNVLALDM